jgi:2-polyprenyl-3-methyl-5-hydroxy-6-metoxy-1,4-benzoquinol methylase
MTEARAAALLQSRAMADVSSLQGVPLRAATTAGDRQRGGCLLCAHPAARLLFTRHWPIVQCSSCGLVYAERGNEDTGAEYREAYYRGEVYADYLAERPVIRKNAEHSLREIEQYAHGRDLLDVGCAAGFFVEAARDHGWRGQGIEISDYAASHARRLGLTVDIGSIEDPPPGLPKFDVVTLWDAIEHLDRPDVALVNIHELLRPGGLLVVSTGDYDSLLRKLTGRRWRLFSDRTHRVFFTERTLGDLLSKSGFRLRRVHHRGKRVGLPMILHQSPLPLGSVVGRWLDRRGWHPSFYVNLRDVMTVFVTAEKPS